jgi:protein-disulfide isomerase
MRNWTYFALTFVVGVAFGYLVSEKFTGDTRIEELTERLAKLETTPAPVQAPLPQRAVPPAQRRETDIAIDGAPIRGPKDAPITIVAFSDFQCPYCSRAHPTMQRVLATYPQSVRLVFKHNPLPMHPDAPLAHRASIAAGEQNRFWEMHDLIFDNIRDLSRSTLVSYATELDLDLSKFVADLDSDRVTKILNDDMAESQRLGVNGTPTFYINGQFVSGAQPFENFQTLIERELAVVDAS